MSPTMLAGRRQGPATGRSVLWTSAGVPILVAGVVPVERVQLNLTAPSEVGATP